MTGDSDHPVSTQPGGGHDGPHRRVSIVEGHGHDNPAFDSPRSRKVSAASEHAEMGPVRKKSILHNAHAGENNSLGGGDGGNKHANGDTRIKKHSVTDSVHSKRSRYSDVDEKGRSWWYAFCVKCRDEEELPAWQPSGWSKVCPYPFCLSYRQFSRIVTLCLIVVFSYGVLYAIIGDSAAPPNGTVWQIILLSIISFLGGWLVSLTTLPPLVGMLFTGLILQNTGVVDLDDHFSHITSEIRKLALVIILIRAGLDLDPGAMKKLKFTVLKLGLGPWIVEAAVVTVMAHYILHLPWMFGLALGSAIAAVSPAVVVACLLRIREKGYGVAKGIPTLIIAVSGIDDALSVAGFGIVKSFIDADEGSSITSQITQGPVCIVGGIGFGVIWGIVAKYVPERHDPFLVPLRVLYLLVGGAIAVFGSEILGYEGAGPLGAVSAGFVCLVVWSKLGWEVEDNPAATAFEIFWTIIQPVLFGVTGAAVKLGELEGKFVLLGLAILVTGVVIRIFATVLMGIGCGLNLKEKFFVALCWMSKATVQAALAGMLLNISDDAIYKEYGEKFMTVCVLSIILTAPLAAALITITGPRLLTKTTVPQVPEGWRRSHRPSIRDISIIDEEEERDNIETGSDNNAFQKDNNTPKYESRD